MPYEETIVKHSKDLIDLIEVGDFVNGRRVIRIYEEDIEYLKPKKTIREKLIMLGDMCSVCKLQELKIETILTKEQYEKNCYRVIPEEK